MEFPRSVPAIRFAGLPYFFVLLRTLLFGVQLQLYRALHVVTKFPTFIFHISLDRHCLTFFVDPTQRYIRATYKFCKVGSMSDSTKKLLVLIIIILFVLSVVASALLSLLK
jgi:hypothetical protein